MTTGVDSVLLIAFGGPEKPEDIRPFLEIVTAGRAVPAGRLEAVARHYEEMGGRSPLNDLTVRQADGLRAALHRDGIDTPVYVGMRNWRPFLKETLTEMRDRGRRRALGIILSSFQVEASWERYVADVTAARAAVGARAPEVVYAPPWSTHPRFIETMVARASEALDQVPSARRGAAPLVFTAHSVPVSMAHGAPYVAQLQTASRAVAERLGHARWCLAYQSHSGSPREDWLGPDIVDRLRELAATGVRDVVVVPIGFVCDHVEVLYDLDVEARTVAEQLGVDFHRAPAANDHPSFIAMLADLVREARAA